MARIVYSALVESIRGSIAGTTFQKNKYGYSVKKKPNMVHPNTPRQQERKSIVSVVTRAWRDLTQSQRDLYDTFASSFPQYAKHNPSSQLDGYSVFVKYNCHYYKIIGSVRATITQAVPTTDVITYTVTNDSGVLKINMVSTEEDEAWECLFFMSRSLGATRKFVGSSPKYIGNLANSTQSLTITSLYTSIYGAVPAVGALVALDVVLISGDSPFVLARDSQIYTVGETP